MFGGGRWRQGGFALFLLFAEIMRFGFDRIPPVTLLTLGLNVAVFLRLLLPFGINNVCISVRHVWYGGDWSRLFLGSVFHANDWHLYYNMVSLLWKGSHLERRYGSPYFAYMLIVFTALTHSLLVALNIGLYEFTHDYSSYISSCAVGFSGVLFALKVILNHINPTGAQYVMGIIPVPSKWVCWAELVLIQVLVPNASFVGHLAGILIGLSFIKGPLKPIMDLLASLVTPSRNGINGRSYSYHNERSGYRPAGSGSQAHNRNIYEQYTGGMSEDEQIEWALNNSARTPAYPSAPPSEGHTDSSYHSTGGAPYPETPNMPQPMNYEGQSNRLYPNLPPDVDDLRQRRMARFN